MLDFLKVQGYNNNKFGGVGNGMTALILANSDIVKVRVLPPPPSEMTFEKESFQMGYWN